jgi:ribosomal protein L35AE/L33A
MTVTGVFRGYAGGRKTQKSRYALIQLHGLDDARVGQHIGSKVIYNTRSGKKLIGTILRVHGGNDLVRACFRRGLPHQAVGHNVTII